MIAEHDSAHIYFSGRNAAKAEELISEVKKASPKASLSFIECDLTSLASVKKAAQQFIAKSSRLDVLICNAGVMALGPGVTKDGYEIHFGTNHVGHALLIKLLLPCMLDTAAQPGSDVRIVNLTSEAYTAIPKNGIDFDTLKSNQAHLGSLMLPGKWMRYGQSKLANLLYAQELSRRYPMITSVAVHPGFIRTGLSEHLGLFDRILVQVASKGNWTPLEEGAYNQTWAATAAKQNLENGVFYKPVGIMPELEVAQAKDKALAEKLWRWTEEELVVY